MASDLLLRIEEDLERALRDHEQRGEPAAALTAYERALAALDRFPRSAVVQRLRAYALMRAANVLNELDRLDEALACSERALVAAERSADEIALGRAQLAQAAVHLTRREIEPGLLMLHAAAETFSRGDSREHHEGLGWVHVIQADLRVLGLVESEPTEIVTRAEEALALLRPLATWPGIERAHAARAVAWATYGWREIWQRFERAATLRDSRARSAAGSRDGRLALFAIRFRVEPLIEGLKPLRGALARFDDCVNLWPHHSLHIAVQPIGLVSSESAAPAEVSPADLENLAARAALLVRGYGPLELVLANVNAFPEEIFLEVHDPTGRLPALCDRLNHLRPTAGLLSEMIPRLTVASAIVDTPAPAALIEALRVYRRWPVGELHVPTVELITLDPHPPYGTPQRIATLAL